VTRSLFVVSNQTSSWLTSSWSEENDEHVFLQLVFRIAKDNNNTDHCLFVDANCRIYDGWRDYHENNKQPECKYCYPRHGVYEANDHGVVKVDFCKSPACDVSAEVFNALDLTNCVISIGLNLLTVTVMMIPVAGIILTTVLLQYVDW